MRVYARVLWCRQIFTYIHTYNILQAVLQYYIPSRALKKEGGGERVPSPVPIILSNNSSTGPQPVAHHPNPAHLDILTAHPTTDYSAASEPRFRQTPKLHFTTPLHAQSTVADYIERLARPWGWRAPRDRASCSASAETARAPQPPSSQSDGVINTNSTLELTLIIR